MVFIVIASTHFLRREVPVSLSFDNFVRTFIAALIFLGVLVWAKGSFVVGNQYVKVLLSVLVSGGAYIGAVFFMRVLTMREITRLKKLVFK